MRLRRLRLLRRVSSRCGGFTLSFMAESTELFVKGGSMKKFDRVMAGCDNHRYS